MEHGHQDGLNRTPEVAKDKHLMVVCSLPHFAALLMIKFGQYADRDYWFVFGSGDMNIKEMVGWLRVPKELDMGIRTGGTNLVWGLKG